MLALQAEDAEEGDDKLDSSDTAEPADTDAEHKMMRGVLDSLIEDDEHDGAGNTGAKVLPHG